MSFISNIIFLQGFEDKSALVVKDSRYFKQWTGLREFNCRFTVSSSSSSGLGLFAVIQRMSFRRDEEGNCIDYVKVCCFLLLLIHIFYHIRIICLVSPC